MTEFKSKTFTEEGEFLSSMIIEEAEILDELFEEKLMPSRETSLAKTKLEEAVMWANKSIALNGRK